LALAFTGALLMLKHSRIYNLIDFYLAPRLANLSQQHATRAGLGVQPLADIKHADQILPAGLPPIPF